MTDQTRIPTVFQHKKRPNWGLSFLLWEREGKRSYLFENGQLRTLASDFSTMMLPVNAPDEEVQAMLARLKPQLDALQERGTVTKRHSSKQSSPTFSFDQQLVTFLEDFPGGFSGKLWRNKVRGDNARKRLKRHRDAALNDAKDQWQQTRLQPLLEVGDYSGVWERIMTVLSGTDLVPAQQTKKLAQLPPDMERQLAQAVVDLLHPQPADTADETFNERLSSLLSALKRATGKKPTWQLGTVILALYDPERHVCVRPSSFAEQAKSLSPNTPKSSEASTSMYGAYQRMAESIKQKLEQHGYAPADLMDVHDFIRVTTSPKARKRMLRKDAELALEPTTALKNTADNETEADADTQDEAA